MAKGKKPFQIKTVYDKINTLMRELSLNILDIAENSVKAGASRVKIEILVEQNDIFITISDNGCGMDEALLKRVIDPFTTTRTTRKVGMGIPLFKMQCEQTGGSFTIESQKGVGTKVKAVLKKDSIDREPLGDIADTLSALICADSKIDYYFSLSCDGKSYQLDTAELKQVLEGVPLDEPEVIVAVRKDIEQGVADVDANI